MGRGMSRLEEVEQGEGWGVSGTNTWTFLCFVVTTVSSSRFTP